MQPAEPTAVEDGAQGADEVGAEEVGAEVVTLSDLERGERLAQLNALIEMMRPAVQSDGGDLALVSVDVVKGDVEVMLQGSCSSCAISATTLQAGVQRILKDRLPWVTEVRGGVDETMDFDESASMGRGGYVPRF